MFVSHCTATQRTENATATNLNRSKFIYLLVLEHHVIKLIQKSTLIFCIVLSLENSNQPWCKAILCNWVFIVQYAFQVLSLVLAGLYVMKIWRYQEYGICSLKI